MSIILVLALRLDRPHGIRFDLLSIVVNAVASCTVISSRLRTCFPTVDLILANQPAAVKHSTISRAPSGPDQLKWLPARRIFSLTVKNRGPRLFAAAVTVQPHSFEHANILLFDAAKVFVT